MPQPFPGETMQKESQTALAVILLALVGTTAASAQPRQQGAGVVRSAERGDARAQTALGYMFATGRRVPQNFALAAYWYTRAAEQGNPDAQYLLGVSYDLGRGVPVNWVLAYKWLDLSAARTQPGEEREFRAKMRDAVATKLGPSSLAVAQGLAVAWYPRR
jgi:TPR repeat protein